MVFQPRERFIEGFNGENEGERPFG